MALLITILLMLINLSGTAHENTPSSDTFSMIDLWILICIIFVTLALFEYGLVIKIKYSKRGPSAEVHLMDNCTDWPKVTCMFTCSLSADKISTVISIHISPHSPIDD